MSGARSNSKRTAYWKTRLNELCQSEQLQRPVYTVESAGKTDFGVDQWTAFVTVGSWKSELCRAAGKKADAENAAAHNMVVKLTRPEKGQVLNKMQEKFARLERLFNDDDDDDDDESSDSGSYDEVGELVSVHSERDGKTVYQIEFDTEAAPRLKPGQRVIVFGTDTPLKKYKGSID